MKTFNHAGPTECSYSICRNIRFFNATCMSNNLGVSVDPAQWAAMRKHILHIPRSRHGQRSPGNHDIFHTERPELAYLPFQHGRAAKGGRAFSVPIREDWPPAKLRRSIFYIHSAFPLGKVSRKIRT